MSDNKKITSFSFFVASRILKPQQKSFSGPIIRISIVSLILGLSVMIISLAVLIGFKKEIRDKLSGFTGHIQITKYDANPSLELPPLELKNIDIAQLEQINGITKIEAFISKAAIIRTEDEMQGMMVKGVGHDFDSSFFSRHLLAGKIPAFYEEVKTDEVLISKNIADLLEIQLGDRLRVYFLNNESGQLRGRRFEVSGIYRTSVEEFDERFMLADIRHLQKLNNWESHQVSGLEIYVEDFKQMEQIEEAVYENIPYDLNTENIKERYPQIFDWLDLQDINVIVILVLIILVSTVSMISTLLVLIIERTRMIGVLKALGAQNKQIRNVFLIQATYIIIIGMMLGNALGMGLAFLQKKSGLVHLDPDTYYMSVVPIHLDWFSILSLNLGTLLLILLFMLLPSWITSRIEPSKSIRFD
jgi:lipoprotein-releasing system permease protein